MKLPKTATRVLDGGASASYGVRVSRSSQGLRAIEVNIAFMFVSVAARHGLRKAKGRDPITPSSEARRSAHQESASSHAQSRARALRPGLLMKIRRFLTRPQPQLRKSICRRRCRSGSTSDQVDSDQGVNFTQARAPSTPGHAEIPHELAACRLARNPGGYVRATHPRATGLRLRAGRGASCCAG
jgi:hypothetical protein